MADFNNFANYSYVQARNFRTLKEQLINIDVPVTLIRMDVRDNGSAYAIVMLDRNEKSVHTRRKTKKTEVVDDSM